MSATNPFRAPNITEPTFIGSEGERAVAAAEAWLKGRGKQVFRIDGPAGTGKSTLAMAIAARVNGTTCFAAFSGKAASVLRRKGCADATTIHNLIYTPALDKQKQLTFILNEQSRLTTAALAIIDECSMVDSRLGRDLQSFNRPILVLGDSAQLPPIDGRGFFAGKPDILLAEIHRQEANSPVIKLATKVREGKSLAIEDFGDSFVRRKLDVDIDTFLRADQILVGTNETKHRINVRIRELRGLPPGQPQPNEKLVCLKNNASKGIFNGEIYFVTEITETFDNIMRMKVRSETGDRSDISVNVPREFFEEDNPKLPEKLVKHVDQFAFAYALTVHKAQGSEWPSVVLYDESKTFGEHQANWLYTGITRASESIKIYV